MNLSTDSNFSTPTGRWPGSRGSARTIAFPLAFFVAGVAVAALWFNRSSPSAPARPHSEPDAKPEPRLSVGTENLLQHLDLPLKIHFYSLLDPAGTTDSLKPFSARISQLLARFQRASNGKLKVAEFDSRSETNLSSAANDGLMGFNLDKGDACFLGLAVVCKITRETLPRLSPDWEPALEFDLRRAIEKVVDANKGVQSSALARPADTAALDEVKRVVPNWASVSLEEARSILRGASLNELADTVLDMDGKVKEAEQAFTQAQTNQSAADQEAARKKVRDLQAEQAQKVKDVMAKSAAQLRALEQLKAASK